MSMKEMYSRSIELINYIQKWTRASTRERKKSEAKIWYTIHRYNGRLMN